MLQSPFRNEGLQEYKVYTISVYDVLDAEIGKQIKPSDRNFRTVEGAFQAAKLAFLDFENGESPYFEWRFDYSGGATPRLTEQGKELIQKLRNATGSEAKHLGRTIVGLNSSMWDANSSEVMKALLELSFAQNPQAFQKLLDTGNAVLTHAQDKGKWGTEFPKLLMEVREELKSEHSELATPLQTEIEAKPTAPITEKIQQPTKKQPLKSEKSDTFALSEILENPDNPHYSTVYSAILDKLIAHNRLDLVNQPVSETIKYIESILPITNITNVEDFLNNLNNCK